MILRANVVSRLSLLVAFVGFLSVSPSDAVAEAAEVRLSQQYGLNFLPVVTVVERQLIEKHARKVGIPDVKVISRQLGGGAAANDAILSGHVDFNATGIGPLISMWAKTSGGLNVRAVLPIARTPTTLVTIDPRIQSIKDYLNTKDSQIALPAPKVSVQARVLQMAAAKEFGPDEMFSLDRVTVPMKNPDAYIALATGGSSVKSHFVIEPFTTMELKVEGARSILSSYDVLGGKHTLTLLWTTEKFRENNPKLYGAVVAAFTEAMQWIVANPAEAASMYARVTKSKMSPDEIESIITDADKMEYSPVPMRTFDFTKFMYEIGAIKKKPEDWKDLFFPSAHELPGS